MSELGGMTSQKSFKAVPFSVGMAYCCKLLVKQHRPSWIAPPLKYLALSNPFPGEISGLSLFVTKLNCLLRPSVGG